MRICQYCEAEISDTARKCKYCGEWVDKENLKNNLLKKESNIKSNNGEPATRLCRFFAFLIDIIFYRTYIGALVNLILSLWGKTLGTILLGIKYSSLDGVNEPKYGKRIFVILIWTLLQLLGGALGILKTFIYIPIGYKTLLGFLGIAGFILFILAIVDLFFKTPTPFDKRNNIIQLQYKRSNIGIIIFISIIFMLLLMIVYGNKSGNSYDNQNDNLSKIVESSNIEPYITYYGNGNILEKGGFLNGEKEGFWETYYENGKKKTKGSYVNGKPQGEWITYYDSCIELGFSSCTELNNMESMGKYENGLKEGEWFTYYENGAVKSRGEYENGLKEGERFSYYRNGQVEYQGEYSKGKKVGHWTVFNGDGRVLEHENYESGDFVKL